MKRTLFALPALLLLGISNLFAAEPNPVKYAVLVGVTEYDHPRFKSLNFAENDVVELGQKLRSGGFRVIMLTQSAGTKDARLKPSRANILRELDSVLNAATKHDMVLVALSGHGLQPSGSKENFFCPADARPQDLDTLIGMAALYDRLDRSAAEVKLLLADACRDDPVAGKGITTVPLPPPGVGVLLSCSPGEQAYEHKSLKHGVFFHFLLEGLNGRGNDDGEITFGQLAEYVQRKVARTVPKLIGDGATQSPNLVVNISGPSPVLLKSNAQSRESAGNVAANIGGSAKSAAGDLPARTEVVGNWAAPNGVTLHFHANGSMASANGNYYLRGSYTYSQGQLTIQLEDSSKMKAAVKWSDTIKKDGLIVEAMESNSQNVPVGKKAAWFKSTKQEPPAPPEARDWVGHGWTAADGTTYFFNANGTGTVQAAGMQFSIRYSFVGNLLRVDYPNNQWATGLITWADPNEKTTLRCTVVTSNVANGQPPGTSIDCRRTR